MVFPYDSADIAVDLFVNDGWTDIASSVYLRDLIKVTRGRPDEKAGAAPPSSCTLTLNNRLGTFSPHNPVSPYYESLGQNTPLRVAIRTAEDAFGRTASNGWGTADRGGAWTNSSGVAGDFAVAAGVATHTISAALSFRLSYLGSQLYRDADIAATVTLPFSNVTGGTVEPLNLVVGGVSTLDYFILGLKITTAEVITLNLSNRDGTDFTGDIPITLAYTGQALRARLQLSGQTLRAKVWNASSTEPYDWDIETSTALDAYINRAAGWVGIRSGVAAGNTNVPVVFSYDNVEIRCNRFHGEVSGWPAEWDVSGNDVYVPVTASGIRRRLGQGAAALRSAYSRANAAASPAPLGYWPVEDESGATSIASGLPGGAPMTLSGIGTTTFATNSDFPGSAPIAKPTNDRWSAPRIVGAAATGEVQVKFLLSVPSTGETDQASFAQIGLTGTLGFVDVRYQTGGSLKLQFYGQDRVTISTSGTLATALNGRPVLVSVELAQNGANIDYTIGITGPGDGAAVETSGSLVGRTLGSIVSLLVTPYREVTASALGHVVLRNSIVSIFEFGNELDAFNGEYAVSRVERLCDENDGINMTSFQGLWPYSTQVGDQRVKTLLELLDEAVAADLGVLQESRSIAGFTHRWGRSLCNQRTVLTLDYNAGQVQPPFSPVGDDQYINNDVTVKRTDGSSYQAAQETGPLAVTSPTSGTGVGRYDTTVELNLYSDTQLPDTATWILHTGTVNEPRYPQLVVNVAKLATISEQLMLNALAVDLEDRITITNPKTPITYNTIEQITPGYTEAFGGQQHQIVFNCVPESPYEIVRLNDDARGKLDSLTSTLAGPVTSTGTKLVVVDTTSVGWTTAAGDMPIPITVSGEAMSVTAVTALGASLLNVGTAAVGNNAAVVPGLPASLAEGHAMYCLTSIRNSPDGAPSMAADWTLLGYANNFCLFGKIATSSESAPTVSFSGGIANATTIAQIAAFPGGSLEVVSANASLNASAQNIAYPTTPLPAGRTITLYLGWKQDDWTSVATLTGATEIAETSSTTGDDAGIVWDHAIANNKFDTTIAAGSFVVTGGASAISRGMVIVLNASAQTMTVTRSINSVVKAQAYAAAVSLTRPATLGQ